VIAAMIVHALPKLPMTWRRLLCAFGCCGIASNLLFGSALWPLIGNGLLLVLTLSAGILLIALHGQRTDAPRSLQWLCSMGRSSYEIYLTHMFIVFAAVAIYRHAEADPWFGFLWYAPVVLLCGLLGAAFSHGFSIPCERAMRARWLRNPRAQTQTLSITIDS
jgi:peptidoglycan/LPS O-acetylase OafA/YrhL